MTLVIQSKPETITRDTSLSHFLLMFGYKLFSLYFPLYLVANNFSLSQVGYTNFLIYLPIALFAPVVGFLNHKINPAILMVLGILGYASYSIGMILFPNLIVFYILQIILGISGALFFVSSRAALMGAKLKNPDGSFGWFYSAANYGDAFAPALGAFLIWKFGFTGVFTAAAIIQVTAAIYCFLSLRKSQVEQVDNIPLKESLNNYSRVVQTMGTKKSWLFIGVAFLILILGGFNNTFFPLFLKSLGWSQNKILIFSSSLSIIFLPLSVWVIKIISQRRSEVNFSLGAKIVGVFSVILGILANYLNAVCMFFIRLGNNIGGLMASSGRSGLMAANLKEYPKESAAVDTIFSPFATAFGALFGGWLVSAFGYPFIFISFGSLIFGFAFLLKEN
ncbi:MAG TPA: MFS transporter [Candidatus Pacearchaeota archaeon]|nr:MFS transporter [Candidatus Pacearchaeota archaeon]